MPPPWARPGLRPAGSAPTGGPGPSTGPRGTAARAGQDRGPGGVPDLPPLGEDEVLVLAYCGTPDPSADRPPLNAVPDGERRMVIELICHYAAEFAGNGNLAYDVAVCRAMEDRHGYNLSLPCVVEVLIRHAPQLLEVPQSMRDYLTAERDAGRSSRRSDRHYLT
jgi:hypothetical protein